MIVFFLSFFLNKLQVIVHLSYVPECTPQKRVVWPPTRRSGACWPKIHLKIEFGGLFSQLYLILLPFSFVQVPEILLHGRRCSGHRVETLTPCFSSSEQLSSLLSYPYHCSDAAKKSRTKAGESQLVCHGKSAIRCALRCFFAKCLSINRKSETHGNLLTFKSEFGLKKGDSLPQTLSNDTLMSILFATVDLRVTFNALPF